MWVGRTSGPGPICGETFVGSTGIEWVCVRPPHNHATMRVVRDERGVESLVEDTRSVPEYDRHRFVPRRHIGRPLY